MSTLTKQPVYPPKYKQRTFLEVVFRPYKFLSECQFSYPDILKFDLVRRHVYVLQNPEFVKYVLQENHKNYLKGEAYDILGILLGNGLLNSEGEFWKRQRRLAQPAFHRESLENISKIIVDSTQAMLQRWKKMEGQTINFTREMAGLTIEIVAKALFTADVTSDNISTVWESVNFLNQLAIKKVSNPLALPFWVPTITHHKTKKAIGRLDKIVYGIIDKRKPNSGQQDLLQMFMDAIDEETQEQMTREQLRDEVMTIFLAGHETTVNSLSWTWYLLKQHPDAERKVADELQAVLDNNTPGFTDLVKLAYGQSVIKEAMRMFPSVYAIGRKPIEFDNICGYDVPLNTRVILNIIGLHRHPAYWDDPLIFKPERFDGLELKGDTRFKYMPFGGGPRICIGNNFAMMEMQIINAMLMQHVEFELTSKDIRPIPQITLKPGNGVMIKLKSVSL